MSDLLGNSNLASVKVESYFGIGETKSNPTLTQGLIGIVTGQSVLVVDEIADSGRSLRLVTQHLRKQGAKEVRTAALYVKSCCDFIPDFFEVETNCWVIFPWELKETISEILKAHKLDSIQSETEISKVARAGVSKHLVARFRKEFSEAKLC